MKKNNGFTLIEVLVVLAISAILVAISLSSYSSWNKNTEFNISGKTVSSYLSDARNLTLASKNSSVYGVHLETTKVVLFTGDTYSSSEPSNKEYIFPNNVQISVINLNGGGSDVIFNRLTGETNQFGTTTISRIDDPSSTIDIVVKQTGVIEF